MHKKLLAYTIIGILFTAILGTLLHFTYQWSHENYFVGLFSPVNESTWEHMKLLFFPMFFYGIFAELYLKTDFPCISFAYPIGILIGTLAIPVIFYTYTGILGNNYMVLDILTFYISLILAFVMIYLIASRCQEQKNPLLPRLFTFLLFAAFILFTFSPPALGIFLPPVNNG